MTNRIDLASVEADALTAMLKLENYVAQTALSAALKELIKIRASMLNQCAYCIEMHVEAAEKVGIEKNKLFALAAWRESPYFNDTERAVLALTDEITLIANAGLSEAVYQTCLTQLGEVQLAQAMMQVITINAWNRFALATKMTHSQA